MKRYGPDDYERCEECGEWFLIPDPDLPPPRHDGRVLCDACLPCKQCHGRGTLALGDRRVPCPMCLHRAAVVRESRT